MKIVTKLMLLGYAALMYCMPIGAQSQWSYIHQKTFSQAELRKNKNKKELVFTKQNINNFSQLIFAWNALRPKNGYYSFFVQARNARSKKWGKWHRMVEWGAKKQRSFYSKSDGFSKYLYVRLETERSKLADAFRVKIEGNNGACLDGVHGFTATTVHLGKFKSELLELSAKRLQSVYVTQVPRLSQLALKHPEKKRLCSPTSCTMLTHYLTGQRKNPIHFAQNAFDQGLDAYGSWPFNTAHAFEQCNGSMLFFPTRLNSFTEIHQQLKRGIPVVASVRGMLPGAPKSYDNGHLLVIVGWDAATREVICHDPAFKTHKQTLQRYPVHRFVRSWESSRRLVYWAEPVKAV